MQILTDSQEYLDIQQLKDIISIDYQDLFLATAKEKSRLIPGFLVFYGKGNNLFLTTLDPYFEDFVKRLREVYQDEKDRVVCEGMMGQEKIQINSFTKQILLSEELENCSEWYQYYQNKNGYSSSLFFEEDLVSSLFSMIEYHLRETSKMWNQTMGKMKISGGSNGVYSIETTINNHYSICPIYFEKQDSNCFTLTIGNALEKSIPLQMDIQFTKNGLKVHNSILEYDYSDYYQYDFSKDYPSVVRDVSLKGELKHYSNQHLTETEKPMESLLEIDQSPSSPKWYQLPWNGFIGKEVNKEQVREDKEILSQKLYFYYPSDKQMFLKELGSKRLCSTTTSCDDLILDSIVKDTIGIKHKNCILLETSFDSLGTTGYYKTFLSGKHFYHVSPLCEWNQIDKSKVFIIGKENGIEDKVDLFDEKKYIKK